MIEVVIENVEKITKYKAIDGTIFENSEECKKYEKSAFCVINAKYQKLIVKKDSEFNILNTGSDDVNLEILKANSIEDVNTIYQMLCYYKDCSIKWYEKIENTIEQNNNYFIVYHNVYDNYRGPLCTTQEIIDNLTKF